jgi:Ulp1 family protease
VATLRDYLRIEYKVKEGKDREFNKDTIKGSTPRVPQQTNFTDCGVYVLQYVESFFQVMLSCLGSSDIHIIEM